MPRYIYTYIYPYTNKPGLFPLQNRLWSKFSCFSAGTANVQYTTVPHIMSYNSGEGQCCVYSDGRALEPRTVCVLWDLLVP